MHCLFLAISLSTTLYMVCSLYLLTLIYNLLFRNVIHPWIVMHIPLALPITLFHIHITNKSLHLCTLTCYLCHVFHQIMILPLLSFLRNIHFLQLLNISIDHIDDVFYYHMMIHICMLLVLLIHYWLLLLLDYILSHIILLIHYLMHTIYVIII